jgi:hypothetical protein
MIRGNRFVDSEPSGAACLLSARFLCPLAQ